MAKAKWSTLHGSVIGTTHVRKGTPNQDAVGVYQLGGEREATALAVSDGHGSSACFRSDIGSAFAVNAAIHELADFWEFSKEFASDEDSTTRTRLHAVENFVRRELPERIISRWRDKVETHSERTPIETNPADADLYRVYGATLQFVLASQSFCVFGKLGDGNLLVVDHQGKVEERFVKSTEEEIGDETDSLCLMDASKKFAIDFEHYPSAQKLPDLLMACTDGLSNAFKEKTGLVEFASDVCRYFYEEKQLHMLHNDLTGWLKDYSGFSGDDVTVGMIFNCNSNRTIDIDFDDSDDSLDAIVLDDEDSVDDQQPTAENNDETPQGTDGITYIESSTTKEVMNENKGIPDSSEKGEI